MNAIVALTRKDLKLLWRGYVLALSLLMVVLGIAVGRYVKGRDLQLAEAIYVVDATEARDLRERVGAGIAGKGFEPVAFDGDLKALASRDGKHHAWLPDEEMLRDALAQAEIGFGAVIEGAPGRYEVRYFMPEVLPEETARLMAGIWEDSLRGSLEGAPAEVSSVPIEKIGGPAVEASPPLGHSFVPLFIFSEAFIIAMWLGAVLLFVERAERTAFAAATSPAGVRSMLLAKALALAVVVVFEVVATVVGVWGYHPGLWAALAVSLVLFAQAMGLVYLFAGWFESLTSFTLVGAGICLVVGLPTASFFVTNFPDLWWLPTYPLFRALREAFFSTGRPELIGSGLAIGLAVAVAFNLAGAAIYKRRLAHA